ncbi:MAG: nuclear transport factor 2 family protein [Pyrinomonadaceae bacterium]|nr:nuclear transport factor 2 family protein [Pyrinomonadaceae bacterium]
MIDKNWAEEFAKEWIEAWNSHDLERIFSHYTDDFEMSSPLIIERMNEPSGTLKGKDKIRPYWENGLKQTPDLHFELENVLVGANSLTILYKNQKNHQVAEVLIFNNDGKAVNGNAHYGKN